MGRQLSTEARSRILASAEDVLRSDGVDGFALDEVARRSGVAKSTIYRHFSSANELLITALDRTIAPFPTPNTGSLRSDLIAFVTTILPTVNDTALRPMMLGMLLASSRDPDLRQLHLAMVNERMGPLKTILDLAKARGEISEDLEFDMACDCIEGPFVNRWLHRPEHLDSVDVEATVDRIIAGLSF